jgi:hypothetical protein
MALADKPQDPVRGGGTEHLSYGVMIDGRGLHAASRESNWFLHNHWYADLQISRDFWTRLKAQGKFAMFAWKPRLGS